MMGLIRDLPDWATGGVTAGALWFGVSYVVLAPRAMDEQAEKVMPVCMEQLEADQDRAIAEATQRAEEERNRKREDALRTIRSRESDLRELEMQLSAARQLGQIFNNSGLGALTGMTIPDVPGGDDIDAIRRSIRETRTALDSLPDIHIPRAPRGELLKTCSCAALKAMAGKRTDYAITMASFRLVTSEKISNARNDMADFLRWDACGDMPWEDLS